eukprot:gb/GECG01002766.1/.p1 GENE.gb/GECG01002766.1/~~gb/GECG01002766.1/.p1  ORF type:complete len:112 (+),score=8.28 gb/GECG01002766.1/:1-336(+)
MLQNLSRYTKSAWTSLYRNYYSSSKMASNGKIIPKIAPSMLSSDFARLAEEAQRMLDNGADYLHMDVMVSGYVKCSLRGRSMMLASLFDESIAGWVSSKMKTNIPLLEAPR